ncbi:bifunctional adenosylcobinamide kinase/adenosylcobinamide-phosphate guanylyltransferase [Jeotgalibacillus sp. R-1-5s-1]|uniref:bifunctional adenosylcobinamide kinase/adenosylcobinamide-phosphate guanylyltransferase n=1 Tax=Jeotgalibacillus sp. R-1-5s-1 TaxID=2555897 RepID=UPI00106BD38C|nr:bifunctional adenosylcobinamide kinase/adenosylcobinamide-phosphate guanylyltransferase [Jeotgalibacillus sp. R-1-5s-1]TFD92925.1 cobinamide kinase [Jeotgalibacillus sp. R-1-5s-1]
MGSVTIIIGGVRSGKTAWAEREAIRRSESAGRTPVYLASGVAFDNEMKERINRHQLDRRQQDWLTIEQPVRIHESLKKLPSESIVVWDCVTTWLTNELIAGTEEHQILEYCCSFIDGAALSHDLLIVSNEVLAEACGPDQMTADFRKIIGELHQMMVKLSHTAIEMESGLALVRKGAVS